MDKIIVSYGKYNICNTYIYIYICINKYIKKNIHIIFHNVYIVHFRHVCVCIELIINLFRNYSVNLFV